MMQLPCAKLVYMMCIYYSAVSDSLAYSKRQGGGGGGQASPSRLHVWATGAPPSAASGPRCTAEVETDSSPNPPLVSLPVRRLSLLCGCVTAIICLASTGVCSPRTGSRCAQGVLASALARARMRELSITPNRGCARLALARARVELDRGAPSQRGAAGLRGGQGTGLRFSTHTRVVRAVQGVRPGPALIQTQPGGAERGREGPGGGERRREGPRGAEVR